MRGGNVWRFACFLDERASASVARAAQALMALAAAGRELVAQIWGLDQIMSSRGKAQWGDGGQLQGQLKVGVEKQNETPPLRGRIQHLARRGG